MEMTGSGGGGGERGFVRELAAASAAARARARAAMAAIISASSSMGTLAAGVSVVVTLVRTTSSSSLESTLLGWEELKFRELPETGAGLGYMFSLYSTGGGVRLASRVRDFEEWNFALAPFLLFGGGEDSESESVMAEPLYLVPR